MTSDRLFLFPVKKYGVGILFPSREGDLNYVILIDISDHAMTKILGDVDSDTPFHVNTINS